MVPMPFKVGAAIIQALYASWDLGKVAYLNCHNPHFGKCGTLHRCVAAHSEATDSKIIPKAFLT